jgi:hypothetical protein
MSVTAQCPRPPLAGVGPRGHRPRGYADLYARYWYERLLGWATHPGPPLLLRTGIRFDVLDLPVDAGLGLLGREQDQGAGPLGRAPVALSGDRSRMWLLVAPGSARELPGLLEWLEWGGISLGLRAHGVGGCVTAPTPDRTPAHPADVTRARGAAVWLRPPDPDQELESLLPAPRPLGTAGTCTTGTGDSGGDAPDLVRLVDAAANQCHRARLLHGNTLRTNGQPLAFS